MYSPYGADLARARRQDLLARAEHARQVDAARRAATGGGWRGVLTCLVRGPFAGSGRTRRQAADLRVARAVPGQRS